MIKVGNLVALAVLAATIIEPSVAQSCIHDLEEIYTAEAGVSDTTRRREYVLCPRRIYEIGTLNFNYDLEGLAVHPPLPIRPNMTISCGDDGARSNLCWIAEGDVHVDATPFRGITDPTVDGVEISGVVFIGARRYSTWATKPGDITFTDCEWRQHTSAVVPIMLDWFDGSETELSVTFDRCDFVDNQYFGRGSHTSLVYGNGQQNSLNFIETKFDNNDMLHNNTLSDTNSFIVETLGPVRMEKSCFRDNRIGVSSVAVFGNSFSNINNFESNSQGNLCGFASVFETLQQFDNFTPICVNPGVDECLAGVTSPPTVSPTTKGPTDAPSDSPSEEPSSSPTTALPTISPAPTVSGQTPAPTAMPAIEPGTAAPAPVGFVFPTEAPTSSSGSTRTYTRQSVMTLGICWSALVFWL